MLKEILAVEEVWTCNYTHCYPYFLKKDVIIKAKAFIEIDTESTNKY